MASILAFAGEKPTVVLRNRAAPAKIQPVIGSGPAGPEGPKGDAGSVTAVNTISPDGSGNVTLAASDVGAVPTVRTVNGKALSGNITLTPADTGAASATSGGAETTGAFPALTGTVTLDCSTASVFQNASSLTGNITVAFSGVPASGKACTITVLIAQNSTLRTVTWPASVKWAGGTAPTQTASKTCVATLITVDGGTTWYGSGGIY